MDLEAGAQQPLRTRRAEQSAAEDADGRDGAPI
jgi:hypothetical protein